MARISDTIPNMVNGVSQQPANLRLPTQGEICENGFCSIVEGLSKRPPSKFRGKLAGVNLSGKSHYHSIDRGDVEKYVVEITNGDLKVFDLDGNPKVVNFPFGKSYLNNASPETRMHAMTVADYTFVVNKDVVTRMETGSSSLALEERAVFWIKQGGYGINYSITTPYWSGGYKTPSAQGWADYPYITTDVIAQVIHTHAGHRNGSNDQLLGTALSSLGAGYSVLRVGSTLSLQALNISLGQVSVSDGLGGSGLKLIYKSVKSLADLPDVCVNGHRVEVVGNDTSSADNYWLSFETNGGGSAGSGLWKEIVAPGHTQRIDAATMPHQLVREANGTFTFSPVDWDERKAGDDETNPIPSFIGSPITSAFFYLNRLGFLSGQNVVLSTAGEFFNFFRPTVATTLDTDPIDVAVTHTKVATLKAALPANKKLLLFSDHTQFVIDTQGQPLTAENLSIPPITEFENTPEKVSPVSNGNFVYFATESGSNAGLLEYYIADSDAAAPSDAAEITAHVPSYIPAGVHDMASSSNDNIISVLSTGEPGSLFVYQFYWAGREKRQSAWHKWSFTGATVRASFFVGSKLYVVLQRDDGVSLESVEVSEGQSDDSLTHLVHLDRRVEESSCVAAYNSGTNMTTVSLPYSDTADKELVIRAGSSKGVPNQIISHTDINDGVLSLKGDYSAAKFYVGTRYKFRYRLSPVVVREEADGGGRNVIADGRLQLKKMTLLYDGSAGFTVEVTPLHRDTNVYEFTGRIIGDGENIIGQVTPDSGEFSFIILSKSDQVKIELINDTFLPSRFLSAEWMGDLTLRSKRL